MVHPKPNHIQTTGDAQGDWQVALIDGLGLLVALLGVLLITVVAFGIL